MKARPLAFLISRTDKWTSSQTKLHNVATSPVINSHLKQIRNLKEIHQQLQETLVRINLPHNSKSVSFGNRKSFYRTQRNKRFERFFLI